MTLTVPACGALICCLGLLPDLPVWSAEQQPPQQDVGSIVEFTKNHIDIDRSHAQGLDVIHFDFPFVYHGKIPSSITKIDSPCGCTEAHADKRKFSQGEAGSISVDFSPMDRVGKVTKTLYAHFEGLERPVPFSFSVQLKPGAELSSKFIYWVVGEPMGKKHVSLMIPDGLASKVTSIEDPDAWFSIEVGPWDPSSRSCEIIATPRSTSVEEKSVVYINLADGQRLHVYVRVIKKK